ncbi:MAG TPA: tripartite tricarboxylate transporter substrate binding protein [Bordetella sp.]|jgi:tripartite-type tricarboxylate transporter receptor subunit TctC|nr:tripartite tricarboxylate transporter substrate binding protein [Bordetella sp.]
MNLIARLGRVAAGFLLAAAASGAYAQAGKTMTVYVPFSAGGSVDIVARLIGQQLGTTRNLSVVVENRPGAGGTIATALVARAKPDGLTLLAHHQGVVYNAALFDNLTFDTRKDLTPVAVVGVTPNVLVVPANSDIKTMADFLAEAKAHPGRLNFGSAGVGSNGHLAMELLESEAHIQLTHVPYKGMPQAVADVASGQIQAVLTTIPAALPFIRGGRVRALATSGLKRSSVLPDLPTIDESGVKGFEYLPWYGFLAPSGTPQDVLDSLSNDIVQAAKQPDIASKLAANGIEVDPWTRQKFLQVFNADLDKWTAIIKRLGLKG